MILTAIDYAIIGAYFAITIGIGFWFRNRASKDIAEYFVSGRSLPWWIAGTSMVATTFAADTPLAVTGLTIQHGLAGNWVWWSFALGGMITVFVYAKLWRRSGVMTDVELVELRYSGKSAALLRGSRAIYVALIVNPIIIGWVTSAMFMVLDETVLFELPASTLEQTVFGDNALSVRPWLIIAGTLMMVGVYGTLSGMWGVAVADALQFCLAMFGCIALAWLAIAHFGGASQLEAKVIENFGEGGTAAFDLIPDFTGANAWLPLHVFLLLLLVQWWATWYPGAEPGGGGFIVQRMAACKDERHSLLATLWFQIAHYCVRPWPWLVVALAALAMYPELRQSELADPAFNSGVGFPRVMRDLSPPGLRGLLTVTFFAAFMSTLSTQMNWGASYISSRCLPAVYASRRNGKTIKPSVALCVADRVAGRWRRVGADVWPIGRRCLAVVIGVGRWHRSRFYAALVLVADQRLERDRFDVRIASVFLDSRTDRACQRTGVRRWRRPHLRAGG
ncbi:sodium:solute symporter family protein [Rosistilla carotiformis]|nr:sodium:solute symporter family protein [Rosistilla carotiformis]